MNEGFKKLEDTFDALSMRERVLAVVTVLALIGLVWHFLLMGSLNKANKEGVNKKLALEKQLATFDEELLKAKSSAQGIAVKEGAIQSKVDNEADSLRREIYALDQKKEELTSGVVKPNEIAGVLKSILVDFSGLHIVRVNVLDATPLDDEAITDIKEYMLSKISRLYKHEIQIELHGNFLSTLRYLKKLESYHKVFYWNEITYKSLAWPNAHIMLNVYTLSSKGDRAGA